MDKKGNSNLRSKIEDEITTLGQALIFYDEEVVSGNWIMRDSI